VARHDQDPSLFHRRRTTRAVTSTGDECSGYRCRCRNPETGVEGRRCSVSEAHAHHRPASSSEARDEDTGYSARPPRGRKRIGTDPCAGYVWEELSAERAQTGTDAVPDRVISIRRDNERGTVAGFQLRRCQIGDAKSSGGSNGRSEERHKSAQRDSTPLRPGCFRRRRLGASWSLCSGEPLLSRAFVIHIQDAVLISVGASVRLGPRSLQAAVLLVEDTV